MICYFCASVLRFSAFVANFKKLKNYVPDSYLCVRSVDRLIFVVFFSFLNYFAMNENLLYGFSQLGSLSTFANQVLLCEKSLCRYLITVPPVNTHKLKKQPLF